MSVKSWIIEWFMKNTFADENELLSGLELNYFQTGWLDSISFISFLSDVEEQFHIEFDNNAFENSEFATISGLARIAEKLI